MPLYNDVGSSGGAKILPKSMLNMSSSMLVALAGGPLPLWALRDLAGIVVLAAAKGERAGGGGRRRPPTTLGCGRRWLLTSSTPVAFFSLFLILNFSFFHFLLE
jgi:hypothetical protein